MPKKKEWFGEWFDSPYYHILYKHRDYHEAQSFIDALHGYFNFGIDDHILDLACGKGRHSIYLNTKGLQVAGVDLSEQNIAHARQFANDRLQFDVHDMRSVYRQDQFDYVLNLFTSFGYFKTDEEHQQAICAAGKNLKAGGKLMLDFLNPYVVVNQLVPEETKEIDGIAFHIRKRLLDGYIVKDIRFEDQNKAYHFTERVKAIRRWDFERYFEAAGLKILSTFGNYQLGEYVPETSERMIFITSKTGNGC